jgi:hypothetical protein
LNTDNTNENPIMNRYADNMFGMLIIADMSLEAAFSVDLASVIQCNVCMELSYKDVNSTSYIYNITVYSKYLFSFLFKFLIYNF